MEFPVKLNWMLPFIPVAIALSWSGANPIVVFAASALAIVPLAALMGAATESLAEVLGPTLGGLLNATLGNAPEIIISLFALQKGLIGIVKASITGSILGNLLFGLGISMFLGGLRVPTQKFQPEVARMNGSLLTLASFGLMIPALFHLNLRHERTHTPTFSVAIALVLFLAYLASVVFTLVTNKAVVGEAGVKAELEEVDGENAEVLATKVGWGRNKAIAILAIVTIAIAIMSEVLTKAIEPASELLGLTPLFSGVFLLALVGNAAELYNAVRFARMDMMDLSIGITIGASTQVALSVAPVLVFCGMFMGQPMNLIFSPYEVWSVVLAVYATRNLVYDGASNWLEGLVLTSVYVMLAIGFYYVP
jgi:Ca2+:H+ antiporter